MIRGFPRPDCPSCAGPLVFWPGYRRYVREAGRHWKIFVPRLRCAQCGVSHALLPAFTLAWRLDVAETIGPAVGEVVADGEFTRLLKRAGLPKIQRPGRPFLLPFLRSAELISDLAAVRESRNDLGTLHA